MTRREINEAGDKEMYGTAKRVVEEHMNDIEYESV